MAKKTKGKQGSKKDKRRSVRRYERRFSPQAGTSPAIVGAVGALAALLLGAGAWALAYGQSFEKDPKLHGVPSYLVAAGALALAVALWIGTSGDAPVRVGAPGIGVEKGQIRRMPWWALKSIRFEDGAAALVIDGNDESGAAWSFKVSLKSHPEAVAWIVSEAKTRISNALSIDEGGSKQIPRALPDAGERLELEALQVVGKRCAATGKVISYEPDARVCTQCERVYHADAVPNECACGASLDELRAERKDEAGEAGSEAGSELES
jgi:hypothetical protein